MGGDSTVEVRGAGEAPDGRTFYVGGFMAYAAFYTAFVALLSELVDIRERGQLKRLRGTPLPLSAFIAARFAIALAITTIGVGTIALCGWVVFGVTTRSEALVALVVYTLAGTVTFVCIGFAATTITRSVSGAQGLSNGIGIILAMISGVFFETGFLPDAARSVARFLPSESLGAWALVAIAVVALSGFQWKSRRQR